jgi:energy-coupling factor transport system permease protein
VALADQPVTDPPAPAGHGPDGDHGRLVVRRFLHPGAWWAWAIGCAVATLRTTNPLLLGLLLGVVGFVVASRRSDAPWARSFGAALRLGVLVVLIRLVFQILFGYRVPGTSLFTVPSVGLPDWAGGVSLGGEVTVESLVLAAIQGLRIAVLLCCIAAASALCSPYRMLRSLPSVLYEAGVAVTVALTAAPQMVLAARRVREARRLRGRSGGGLRALRDVALPVLEGALERSIALAASMDARGYGRRGAASLAAQRLAGSLTLLGLVAAAVGGYGLLDPNAPFALGLPAAALAALSLSGALVVGSRHSVRSRYRPDPWALPEWLTGASGVVVAAALVVAGRMGADLEPSVQPLEVPGFPPVAVVGILVAALPAFVTPLPPRLATVEQDPLGERGAGRDRRRDRRAAAAGGPGAPHQPDPGAVAEVAR